jgi:hypothetical protein
MAFHNVLFDLDYTPVERGISSPATFPCTNNLQDPLLAAEKRLPLDTHALRDFAVLE